MRKRKTGIILGVVLAMLFLGSGLVWAQPTDVQGNWAENQISQWLDKGLAHGYPDGSFKPNDTISRAELIALTNHALGFETTTEINFSDVSASDWFQTEIAKAGAAGYISGYPDGTMRPGQGISRQELAAILIKITDMEAPADSSTLNSFSDSSVIPAWSKPAIAVVVSQGYMRGYPDQTFRPDQTLTRAEAIVTLDNFIKSRFEQVIYNQAGTYGPSSGQETIQGDVTVNVTGIHLQNLLIKGRLTLEESIGEGNVTLKNVTVEGATFIKGGGANSVTLDDCLLPGITVSKNGVRVVATGNTSVKVVRLDNGASLVETSITGPGFETVTLAEIIPSGAKITLSGKFDHVAVASPEVNVLITGSTITQLDVEEKACGSSIDLDRTSQIKTLNLNAAAAVLGQGTIDSAVINVAGTTLVPKPAEIINPNYYTYSKTNTSGPSSTNTGTGSGTGSGGGGGNAPLNLTGSDPADGETGVSRNPRIILTFDRGVVRDHWDNNQNCFTLQDRNGQSIDISVTRADNYLDDSQKSKIYITPDSILTNGMKYTLIISADLQANNDNRMGTEDTVSFTVVTVPSGGGGGSSTPVAPTFTSSEVTTAGDVSITFSKDMEGSANLAGKEDRFIVLVEGNPVVVTGLSLPGTNKIKLTLTTKITSGQVVTVAYTKDVDPAKQIKAADGGVMESFSAQTVTNSLEPEAPTFVSAEVTTTGDVSIIFSEEMESAANLAGKEGQFTVLVEGNSDVVTELNLTSTNKIKLTLTTKIASGQFVTVAYSKDNDTTKQIKSADGGVLESFSAQSVTNGLIPAALSFVSAEVTTNGDVGITFNKDMESTASLAGKEGQFTVLVDGNPDVVTGLSLTSTAAKIKLTLTVKVTNGQTVTVAYTKDGDPVKQVKSADGEVLEDFTAQPATNGTIPAAPVYSSAEVTNKGDISIYLNKEMADPAGKQAQFNVTVDAAATSVASLELTNTVGKIKLVLTDKVLTTGHTIVINYVKGADEASQLRASDGGILDSFTQTFSH